MRTSKVKKNQWLVDNLCFARRPAISSVYANDSCRSYEIVLSKGLSVLDLDLGVVSKTRTLDTRQMRLDCDGL